MQPDDDQLRLSREGGLFRSRLSRFLFKAAVVLVGAVVLVMALAVSIALFAVAALVILVFGGYLWWKTRDLRREIREQMSSQMSSAMRDGDIIEGEVIRKPRPEESKRSEGPDARI